MKTQVENSISPLSSSSSSSSFSISLCRCLCLSLFLSLSFLPLQKVSFAQRGRPLKQTFANPSEFTRSGANYAFNMPSEQRPSRYPSCKTEPLEILVLAIRLAIPDNASPSFPGVAAENLKRQNSGPCSYTSTKIAHTRPDWVKLTFAVYLKLCLRFCCCISDVATFVNRQGTLDQSFFFFRFNHSCAVGLVQNLCGHFTQHAAARSTLVRIWCTEKGVVLVLWNVSNKETLPKIFFKFISNDGWWYNKVRIQMWGRMIDTRHGKDNINQPSK